MVRRVCQLCLILVCLVFVSGISHVGLFGQSVQNPPTTPPAGEKKKPAKLVKLSPKSLPTQYRKWLEEEVPWIITKTEREIFLSLTTDNARDQFIERFWLNRDPTPGTRENEYRQEHYDRLNYVNARFSESGPGWNTDRGRIYILLGKPAQITEWSQQYQIYPVELWFYSARQHRSLPNSFYILFFQKDGIGDFRIYSPFNDGPQALVHSAQTNDPKQCYQMLRSFNLDLARASLTFSPNEPLDVENLQPSFSASTIVAQIRNLPEVETSKAYLSAFVPPDSPLREKVTSRVSFQLTSLKTVFFPSVDSQGRSLTHFAFQISPADLSMVRYKDQYYFSLRVVMDVTDEDGRSLLSYGQDFIRYFSEAEFKRQQNIPVTFEDKIGLVPGKYKLDLLVINNVNGQTYRASRPVEIPEVPMTVPLMSPLLLTYSPRPVQAGSGSVDPLVFAFSGFKFEPLLESTLSAANNLNVLYQLFVPPSLVQSPATLSVVFRILNPGSGAEAFTLKESVPKEKFSPTGFLLNFKQIPLQRINAGRYSLQILLQDTSEHALCSSRVPFLIESASVSAPGRVYISDKVVVDENGIYDFHRAQILWRLGKNESAIAMLREAVRKSPNATEPAVMLAQSELGNGRFREALEILERVTDNSDFSLEGQLALARALCETGPADRAQKQLARLLEKGGLTAGQLKLMAELYERLGDKPKAEAVRQKGGLGGK